MQEKTFSETQIVFYGHRAEAKVGNTCKTLPTAMTIDYYRRRRAVDISLMKGVEQNTYNTIGDKLNAKP